MEKQRALALSLGWSWPLKSNGCLPTINWSCKSFKRIWLLILGAVTGYGYKPFKTLGWMLGMIIFGWVLFSNAYSAKNIIELQESRIFEGEQFETTFATEPYPEFSAFWYSVDTFVPLIDLHQESYWMPNPKEGKVYYVWFLRMKTGAWLRHYLAVHIILGWVLTSLFVVGLTGMMRKNE